MKRPRHKNQKKKPALWGSDQVPAPHYDFRRVCTFDPEFRKFVKIHPNNTVSVDFTVRAASAALATAILRQFFSLQFSLPAGHLTPMIPSRVQYLRWVVSLLPVSAPRRQHALLDIGTGPSTIYTLLGARLYPNWKFVGTDIDDDALAIARGIVATNGLQERISLVHTSPDNPLVSSAYWTSLKGNVPSATMCNPPFFDQVPETEDQDGVPAGVPGQLATAGGEVEFVKRLARDSVNHPEIAAFTSLVGLKDDVKKIEKYLHGDDVRAYQVTCRELKAGEHKARYVVAWCFGPKSSHVAVSGSLEESLWRASISVTPGRRFANRMTSTGIIEVCCGAMKSLDWEEVGKEPVESETVENENETDNSTLHGMGTESSSGRRGEDSSDPLRSGRPAVSIVEKAMGADESKTRVSISCSGLDATSRFTLLLKVEERGGMAGYEVYNVAKKAASQMHRAMNCLPAR